MSSKEETVVYALKGVSKYSRDGHFVDMPDGWEFVPSGDPALTRRLKAAATDYWVVKRKLGQSAVFAILHGHCGISPHQMEIRSNCATLSFGT